jgi:hypothetical protein
MTIIKLTKNKKFYQILVKVLLILNKINKNKMNQFKKKIKMKK